MLENNHRLIAGCLVVFLSGCGGVSGSDVGTPGEPDRRLASDTATSKPDTQSDGSAPPAPNSQPNAVVQQAAPLTPSPAATAEKPNLQQCPVPKASIATSLVGILQEIRSMPENSWRKVNRNTFASVAQPAALKPNCTGSSHSAIINAWGAFAYDPNRGDMITFGGGHADYCGNDVYRFRLSSMQWERAGISSQMTAYQYSAELLWALPAKGLGDAPATAHMYDGLMYIPVADRMVYFGYGAPSWNGTGAPPLTATLPPRTGPWFFDPKKADADKVVGSDGSAADPSIPGGRMWENREYATYHPSAYLPANYGPQMASSGTACENGRDVIYMRTSGPSGVSSGLVKYTVHDAADPARDFLTPVGDLSNHMGQADMGVDTTRLLAVMIGDTSRRFLFWDLASSGPRNPMQVVSTLTDETGTFTLGGSAGMDYDPVRDRFLLWDGQSDVWELRIPMTKPTPTTSWSVRRVISAGGPEGALLPGSGGANGKWKYAPGMDVFLGLREAPNGDVWIYKPAGWVDPAL